MSTLIADVRYSIRSLLKNPGLTLAAGLSLGLGIGANTTIFTWVQAVLFRPIPIAVDPGALRIAAMIRAGCVPGQRERMRGGRGSAASR